MIYLEIKALAGGEVGVELTANEFKHMKKHRNRYRVCIVTNALTKKPTLSIYGYVPESKRWEHHETGALIHIDPVWVQTARLHV